LRASTAQYIGATRKDKKITWDTNAIVAISEDEWKKFRREYRRAVDDGALKVRTEAEYKSFVGERDKADVELENKLLADRKKADRKAKKEASSAGSSGPVEDTDPTTELPSSEGASEQSSTEDSTS